jgi:hypothetical protein
MFEIALFSHKLNNTDSLALKIYEQLYANELLLHPVIYTDHNSAPITKNIPIFSTLYLRHCFYNYYILVYHTDLKYVPKDKLDRCMVIYDSDEAIGSNESYLNIRWTNLIDAINSIKDKLNEKV